MDDAAVEVGGEAGESHVGPGVGVEGAVVEVGHSEVEVEEEFLIPIGFNLLHSDEALFVVASNVGVSRR